MAATRLRTFAWLRAHQTPDSFQSDSILFNNIIIPTTDAAMGLVLLTARRSVVWKAALVTTLFMAFWTQGDATIWRRRALGPSQCCRRAGYGLGELHLMSRIWQCQ